MSEIRAKLQSMAVESTAVALTARMDALAAALRDAGVSQEQSASLLASAASASMHALTLDALVDRRPRAVEQPRRAVAPARHRVPVALAA